MAGKRDVIVSVVIPFHGRTQTLARAIRSVLAQDFREGLQIIVVVDGQSEDTAQVRADFPTVEFIQQANAGPGPARNRGIEASSGSYVAFLDADDVWMPTKVRVQVDAMRRAHTSWSQHSYAVVSPAGERIRGVDTTRYCGWVLRTTLLSFRVQTSSVMVRRACLEDPSIRFGDDRVGEDGFLYTELASRYPLQALPDELSHFTWHGANAGGRADVQLWSRARVWTTQRDRVKGELPRTAVLAYAWCGMAAKLLRLSSDLPSRRRLDLLARLAYAPAYIVFRLLSK